MTSSKSKQILLQQLNFLEEQLDVLTRNHKELLIENDLLKKRQDSLVEEKAKLLQKNNFAISKVESMIHRIKSMEA